MSKQATKALIDEKITGNGVQAITGPILNNVLNTMVDDYGTQEEVSQLAQEVNGTNEEQSITAYTTLSGMRMARSNGEVSANANRNLIQFPVVEGKTYHLTVPSLTDNYAAVYAFTDSTSVSAGTRATLPSPVVSGPASNSEYDVVAINKAYLLVCYDSNSVAPTLTTSVHSDGLKDRMDDAEDNIEDLRGDLSDTKQDVEENTGGITAINTRIRPPYYLATSNPNYENDIQELFIVSFPTGDTVLKCYNNKIYLTNSSSTIIAVLSLDGIANGDIVELKITTSNDYANYPTRKTAAYVIFKDVADFASRTTSGTSPQIDRDVADNLAYSPRVSSYLENTIEVCVPDKIYAVVGDTLQLYYRSIFRCVDYSKYAVRIVCDIGHQYTRYYEVTPLAGNVGTHDITFEIRDNNNRSLGKKAVYLVVAPAGSSPSSSVNILCLGASATNQGQWASEFKRRLVGSGGTPSGSNFTNINFVGRMDVTFDGKQVNLEATGGYAFTSYTSIVTARYRFNLPTGAEPNVSVDDVYANNGNTFTVKEKNITAGYFSCDGTGVPQTSGTLTKVSGTGDDEIVFSSFKFSGNPFVYNGVIDMQQYADDYCNPQGAEHGIVDVFFTELLINGSAAYLDDLSTKMSQMQAFITQARAAFPSCKIIIGLAWNPDIWGGMGRDYGASGDWSDAYGMKYTFMNICNAVQQYIKENDLSSYVFIANWLNEFDEEYDMQRSTKKVNTRSSLTEVFGLNGVHPSTVGYNQMADTAWRLFIAKFCQPSPL